MHSYKAVLFLALVALVVARPPFFRLNNPLLKEAEDGGPIPYTNNNQPADQTGSVAGSEVDPYGGQDTGANSGPGGTSANGGISRVSNEVQDQDEDTGSDVDGSVDGGDLNEDNDAGDAAQNTMGGGPELIMDGSGKSVTGRNVGIVFVVLAAVGLIAGAGFIIYRKRRTEAYGARF